MVPLTRGSTTTLRPVMIAMVRATASISALAKFNVTGPPARVDALLTGGACFRFDAGAGLRTTAGAGAGAGAGIWV